MPALKFPSHAAQILGGNRNGRRHGLLQGDDRGGNKETVDEAVCMSLLMHKGKDREEREEEGVLIFCCICDLRDASRCMCFCAACASVQLSAIEFHGGGGGSPAHHLF